MAINYGEARISSTSTNTIMDSKDKFDNFICKLNNTRSYEGYYMFYAGNVKLLELNNKFAYFWQDANGSVCYSPNLLDKKYFSPPITKLGNALSSHFQCSIEVVNNINESFRKQTIATTGLNKALAESQRHDEIFASYQHNFNEPILGKIGMSTNSNQQGLELLEEIGMSEQMLPYPPVVHNQQHQQQLLPDQKQLHKKTIGLSTKQLEYSEQTDHLLINELPVVKEEECKPETKQAFYIDNGSIKKNSYIATKYMTEILSNHDINNSLILAFIFYMAKNNPEQAMKILVWLANSFNLLKKLPFTLVLHSENDTCMKLFYEEIIEPLFNPDHCQRIESDNLDKKQLSTKLNEKVIYNFHNILTPTILKAPAKEFTRRLMYKDSAKLNNKTITTAANILITSTSKYIPLIAKDAPSLVVEVESSLEDFCKANNIIIDPYVVGNLIEKDLLNFASIVRNIDMNRLYSLSNLNYYDANNSTGIMDGDVHILKVFDASIKNRDKVLFKRIETIYYEFIHDFNENRVNRKNLLKYFSMVFGEGIYRNNRALISALKVLSTTEEPFDSEKTFQIGNIVYYNLD